MTEHTKHHHVGRQLLSYGWTGKTADQVIESLKTEDRILCVLTHIAKKLESIEKVICFASQQELEYASDKQRRLRILLDIRWEEWIASLERKHGPCEKRLRSELWVRFNRVFRAELISVDQYGYFACRNQEERLEHPIEWRPPPSLLPKSMQKEYKRWMRRRPRKSTAKEP